MVKNMNEINKYVKELKGYEGYIQFLDEKINNVFFENLKIDFSDDKIIFEAHFYNSKEKKSIAIRQINNKFYIDEVMLQDKDLRDKDIEVFYAKFGNKVKMAQIWEKERDELCENLEVYKFKKSVFVGFKKDEKC